VLDDATTPRRWQAGAAAPGTRWSWRIGGPTVPWREGRVEATVFGPAPRSVRVGWLQSATVDGRRARARWPWPACRSVVVVACNKVRKAALRRRYGGRGARSGVPGTTAGWREVLPCCTGKPERRLREEVVVIAMPPAVWATMLASVGGGVVPLVGGHARRVVWDVLVLFPWRR
jgi:hypothetical protein